MAESKSASVVFTDGSLLAKNAQAAAGSAKSAADNAYNMANNAQRTADGKNSIYRGSDPSTVPTAILKVGDLYFSENAAYIWNGSSWEETVSDTTGKDIHAKVEEAMAESKKSVAELKSDVEAKVKELDDEIAQNEIKTGNALNFYKEQYYLSSSYTELVGGSWSDEVPPRKVEGKYVWSRYVTANVGDPTNQQYSDPVCISGLDGDTGPQGPQGVPGPKGADGRTTYVHVAYADSDDGKSNFSVNYFADALYIGVLTDHTQADSTDYTQYTWSRLKGDAGDQGIPGPKGDNGQTTYVHFAYANITQLAQETWSPKFTLSTQTVVRFGDEASGKWIYKVLPAGDYTANTSTFDGSDPAPWIDKVVQSFSDFSVTESSGRASIGQYTDYTQADSTDPASYKWTKIKGETGPKGDTGDTGFFIGTTPPPNPAKGTVWATNDSSGNMNSAKTWNGSSWVSTAFTQDLVAGNITATKIVGGELDVNKITVKNAQNIPVTSTVSLGKKLSDIEQDADGLSFTVENGGQNLILNSGNPSTREHWGWTGDLRLQTHPFWKNNTENLFVLSNTSSTDEKLLSSDRFQIEPNQTYTLSYYAFNNSTIRDTDVWYLPRKTGSSNDFDTAIHLVDSVKYSADHAQYMKITFNSGDYNEGYIRFDNNASTTEGTSAELWLTDIQLEKGSIATAWHPSPGDIAQLKITADGLNAYVKGSRGSKTLESILSMDPDHSSIAQVVNGQIAAAIGTYSDGTVRIDGKALHINADTKIENATIKSAMIESIEAEKIKTGKLNADEVDIINLTADKIASGTLNGMTITGSKFIANTDNGNLFGTLWKNYQVVVDNTEVNIHGTDSSSNDWESILTSDSLYLQMANDNNTWIKSIDISIVGQNPHINLVNSGPNPGQYSSTYIGSDGVRAPIGQLGNWSMQGSKVLAQSGSLYVANPAGGNFDGNGSVGFQVWSGIGLGKSTIYTPDTDIYIQQGNVGPALDQSYSSAYKTTIHCQKIISQVANTVSSRLSVKTDITKVTYDRALAAVEGTDMYDYRYVSDDSGQHYVSGIIDDVNADPQYHMDRMLINKERTARIDANLVGFHQVVIQKLLERVAALEEKVK